LLVGDNADFFTLATLGTAGGNDSVDGGNGVDALFAGPANDSLDGGPGAPISAMARLEWILALTARLL
jgi:RTX calcium-binding nonapeptide repeat (4 copies)